MEEDKCSLISGWMISIKRAMDVCGLDFNLACKKLAIDTSDFTNPESRISSNNTTEILEFCNQELNRNDFALLVAEQFHPNIFHVLGYAMMSSENLQSALECIAHYKKVVSNTCKLNVLETTNQLIFSMHIFNDKNTNKAVLSYVSVELFIATMVKFSRELAGSNVNPIKILFSYPEPSYDIDFLIKYFKCDIEFDAKNTAIIFDLTQAQNKVIASNSLITQVHEKLLASFMSRIDKDDLQLVAKSKIFELLPLGAFSQPIIAKNLGYSLRSFQRKLKEQGTSYKIILDQTRKELALGYIKQQHLTYTEISYLVGFSCVANFNRAFKQWTNTTPSQYRKSIK